jgi:peptidoglycan/LPS O-acetylase OafA/YrhL
VTFTSNKLPGIPALTGLRFLAAFFILFAHAFDWVAQFQDYSNWRTNSSFMAMFGMPLFFVLSGFVIHYNYRRLFLTQPFGRAIYAFAVARFARLYPLYFVFLIMAIIADQFVLATWERPDFFFSILAFDVTLTQSWFYALFENRLPFFWLFGLAWSISTEMFFYIAYTVLVFAFFRIARITASIVWTFVFTLCALLTLLLVKPYLPEILTLVQRQLPHYVSPEQDFNNSFYFWFFQFSPYVRIFEFILGCLTANTAILLRERKPSRNEIKVATFGLCAALALLVVSGLLYQGVVQTGKLNEYIHYLALNFLCAVPIAFILFYVARYDAPFTRVMASRSLVALGETSYSIYLVHTWTLRPFFRPAPVWNWVWGLETIVRIVVGILFTIVVAYGTYHLIEVPSRRWLRKKLHRQEPVTSSSVAVPVN